MASVVLHLPPDTERKLREKATRTGQSLEAYLEQLARHDAEASNDSGKAPPSLSEEEFESLLDQLSEGPRLPHLPADFSRSDIYADHD
jgi:hypothetical protein